MPRGRSLQCSLDDQRRARHTSTHPTPRYSCIGQIAAFTQRRCVFPCYRVARARVRRVRGCFRQGLVALKGNHQFAQNSTRHGLGLYAYQVWRRSSYLDILGELF